MRFDTDSLHSERENILVLIKGCEEQRMQLLDKLNQEQVETEMTKCTNQAISSYHMEGYCKKGSENIVTKRTLKKADVKNQTAIEDTEEIVNTGGKASLLENKAVFTYTEM